MDFEIENMDQIKVDIYWILYQYSTGNIYFAPLWDSIPNPVIKDLILPERKYIKDIHLLDVTIPQLLPPINERGKYTFAIGALGSGALSFGKFIEKIDFSYSVEDKPYAYELRTIDGIEFIYIPPGSFMMGSDVGGKDEVPMHEVNITKGFWISRYEVTQRQWENVMHDNPSLYKSPAGYRANTSNNPVEQVSWTQVQEFMAAMGDKYRLPTEAEWEYACRAGDTTNYSYNNYYVYNYSSEFAYTSRYIPNPMDPPLGSAPVGKLLPNQWGIYDMHGNIYEWCQDWYSEGYYVKSPADDPKGPENGTARVLRGGAFCYYGSSAISADRFKLEPDESTFYIGFRLVRNE
jgi:formylglycine-generating enzyme required for sulfatase activity